MLNQLGTFENFNSQLHLSGVINQPNKDFAGETFSQISSTFEQQAFQPAHGHQSKKAVGNRKENKLHILSQQDGHTHHNHQADDLLDFEILNKSSLNSPTGTADMGMVYATKSNDGVGILIQNNNITNQNNYHNQSSFNYQNSGLFDEASVLKILDQSISDDFNNDDAKQYQSKVDQIENFKYETEDVLQMITKIQKDLKQHNKNSRQGGIAHGNNQTISIKIEDLKQLEILSTAAMEKIKEIANQGTFLLENNNQKSFQTKQYLENLKVKVKVQLQKYKELCKRQFKKAEEQRFKFVINEYELNSRVSQLEEAFNKQQDEINLQANRNEQLKFEKQLMSKKYEKRLSEIEVNLQTILKSMQQSNKSGERLQRGNNSFCIEATHHSLLQPIIKGANKNQYKGSKIREESEKENESFLSNQGESILQKSNNNSLLQGKSLKSQLINLKHMIKEFKKIDTQNQQEGGSCFQDSQSIHNLLSNLINNKNDSLVQQSQMVKPESSQASVNQAFIESLGSKGINDTISKDGGEINNTSFFGKDFMANQRDINQERQQQNVSSLISYIMSSRRGQPQKREQNILNQQSSIHSYDDDVQRMVYDKFRDLSMTQQEKLISQLWGGAPNEGGLPSDRRDVRIEDILEISKKTFSSIPSSFRTGRGGQEGFQNNNKKNIRDQDQLSMLRLLKGVNDITTSNNDPSFILNQIDSMIQNKDAVDNSRNPKNQHNSTLEISFNHNEIQVLNGKRQRGDIHFVDENEEEKEFNNDDQSLSNFLKLDDKISDRDLHHNKKQQLSGSKNLNSNNRQNQNNFFGSSLDSADLQMGGGIKNSNRGMYDQQNSVEEDMLILSNLCPKGTSQNKVLNLNKPMFENFTDISLIEGNNSISLLNTGQRQGGLGISGSIHKEGGGSLYSGGSSLVQINFAFIPTKQTGPPQFMTIKVQDREVKLPKLDLERVIELERREPFKKNILQNNASYSSSQSSASSQSVTVEPSSFQNESISKQIIGSGNKTSSLKKYTLTSELDHAVIVEEDEKHNQEQSENEAEDHHDNDKMENMFGDFIQELDNEDQRKGNDDTLDLDFGEIKNLDELDNTGQDFDIKNEQIENVNMLEDDILDSNKLLNFENDLQQPQIEQNPSSKDKSNNNHKQSIEITPNKSMHKKSQSESQLMIVNNEQYDLAQLDQVFSEQEQVQPQKSTLNDKLLQLTNSQGSQKNNIPQINFNFNRIKTPKNITRFNLNQIHTNQNAAGNCIKLIKSQTKKRRSTSSDLKKIQNISHDQVKPEESKVDSTQHQQVPHIDKIKALLSKQQTSIKQPITECEEQETESSPNVVPELQQIPHVKQHTIIKGNLIKMSKAQSQQRSLFGNPKPYVSHIHDQAEISVINQTTDDIPLHPEFSVIGINQNQNQSYNNHITKMSKHHNTEDEQSTIIMDKKLKQMKFKQMMKVVQIQKQMSPTEGSVIVNPQLDESHLVQNYFSAAAVAGQQKPQMKLKARGTILKKGSLNPFSADQYSQRNTSGISSHNFYNYGQSNDSNHNQQNGIDSSEFDIASETMNQKTIRTNETTGSHSPLKIQKERSSQSNTPQKRVTVLHKQMIKVNPGVNKVNNINLRRISISKRNIDQSTKDQKDLVNQSEIIGGGLGKNNNSILHVSKFYNSNVSQLLVNDDESLMHSDQYQIGVQSAKSKNTKLVKVVRKSKERKQQQPINISNISINVSQQQIQPSKSSSKLMKKVQKVSIQPSPQVQMDNYYGIEQQESVLMKAPKSKRIIKEPGEHKLQSRSSNMHSNDLRNPYEVISTDGIMTTHSIGITKRSTSKVSKTRKKSNGEIIKHKAKKSGDHTISLSSVSSQKEF